MNEAGLIKDLSAVVGPENCLTGAADTAAFITDWTRRFTGSALAVLRPRTVDEVSKLVRVCAAYRAPVLPQGGNTGLVGGSVPGSVAPVIISTRRLNQIGDVDLVSAQVTAAAGVTLGDLQRRVSDAGLLYGVDVAARDTATIGGTLATNAGGIRVCAFGMTRRQVLGVQAVLPDGSVIDHLGGLEKDNTGYDLAQLLVGSEGTLGIITAARLRLQRPMGDSSLVLVGARDYNHALALVRDARRGGRLLAAEVMDHEGVRLVCEMSDLGWPLQRKDWPLLLLLDVEGDAIDLPDDADATMAFDSRDVDRLWSYRELQTEAASTMGVIHKLDISLPLSQMQLFNENFRALIATEILVTNVTTFGHIADGNIHLEIAGPDPADDSIDGRILELVTSLGGSISSEHGIGTAKAPFLTLSRSPAEIATMRAIKTALDPDWRFAPGVLFP